MDDLSEPVWDAGVIVEETAARGFDIGLAIEKQLHRPGIAPGAAQHTARRRRSCQARLRARQSVIANRQKDEFLAVFSHELRSSLGAIRNAAHFLRMQHIETPAAETARLLIERQVNRMTRLTEDLLDVSRIDSTGPCLHSERIDLRVVVRHALETVESDLGARQHRLQSSLPDAPVWLDADPGRLEQVLVNLLVNAAKYTDCGGDISLCLRHESGAAVVRIRDSGIGIAPDVLPRIFDLFMQAEPASARAATGLGIGLALVRSLVELHGGSVTVVSAGLGQGSEFTVRLPAI